MKRFYILMLVLASLQQGVAQTTKQITNQNLLCAGYFNTLQFSDKTFLTTEIQERIFIEPFAQHQFVARSHFHYVIADGWDGALGMTLFLQNPNDPTVDGITIPELRPHIEFNQKQKLACVTFDHRYTIETRFYQNTNTEQTQLEDGYYFGNFRFRYRIQATIPLFKIKDKHSVKLKLSDEIYINAGSSIVLNTFDQNRVYGGVNIELSKSLSAEIGYLNWFQKRPSGADYYNRNIIRFTLYHKINLAKNSNVN